MKYLYCYVAGIMIMMSLACNSHKHSNTDWPEYLGGVDRNHYSAIRQIDTNNVVDLKIAWEYHTGDPGQMQCSPIVVGKVLYGLTASNQLFAINAETGTPLWRFAPDEVKSSNVNRGVAYWSNGDSGRILFAHKSWLYAVNALTGKPINNFGTDGRVSLRNGLGKNATDKYVVSTTPGTIYKDLIIMPLRVSEEVGASPGYIQAFNVVTGKLVWVFHTIPHPGEKGYHTWPPNAYKDPAIGGANNWAGMALDKKRGILYVPTGSAAFDFYGGNRKGANLFANSLLALNAANGKLIWYYQFVHHDIWDRDLPAPPNLITIERQGKKVDAVAQVTKAGYVYVFDRESGKPLFPIDEKPFPSSTVPGEEAWPTQPIPRLPKPFARQYLTGNDISRFSNKRDSLMAILRESQKGAFQPLGFKETLLFPGADGGAEWGGAAVSPQGIMYVNANEIAWLFSLSKKLSSSDHAIPTGQALYNAHCATCHKEDRTGNPQSGYPSLADVNKKMKPKQVRNILATGRGMMPGFTALTGKQRQQIVNYLFGLEKTEPGDQTHHHSLVSEVPYKFNGYNKFLDENGLPAITPPWGTLTAINLNTGQQVWRIPLGEIDALTAKGIPPTGTQNYGGPLLTAGGLVFIAATKDSRFRAFHYRTGKLLWEYPLPASGFATPITYLINGRQYVVIACGGTKLGTNKGDSFIAFELDKKHP